MRTNYPKTSAKTSNNLTAVLKRRDSRCKAKMAIAGHHSEHARILSTEDTEE
jgi:hypothetical protein